MYIIYYELAWDGINNDKHISERSVIPMRRWRRLDSIASVKEKLNELLDRKELISVKVEVEFDQYEFETPHGQTLIYHDYAVACRVARECGIPVSKIRGRDDGNIRQITRSTRSRRLQQRKSEI